MTKFAIRMSILSKYLDANGQMSADLQSAISPSDALELIKAGYERYISNETIEEPPFDDESSESTLHQFPYAAILSCIDARLSITDIFDDNNGGLSVARIAGNIASTEITGSLEYAVKVAGAKHILVLGHTRCGAVASAKSSTHLGPNLKSLISHVHTGDSDDLDICTVNNVRNTCEVLRRSEILAAAINKNEVEISGAVYDVSTRSVTFL